MEHVKFRRMSEGDRDDYLFLEAHERRFAAGVGGRILDGLAMLDRSLSGYMVSRLEHSLQCATRAFRDGADEDWIVSALVHDIGDLYAPYNHDEMAAAVLRPYVREQCAWTIAHHGTFQRYYYAHHFGGDRELRQKHKDSPYYEDCVTFCDRWDQASFDPAYESEPLDFFRPMVERVFTREPYAPAVIAPGIRMPLVDRRVAEGRTAA